jgi:hypothetical protein
MPIFGACGAFRLRMLSLCFEAQLCYFLVTSSYRSILEFLKLCTF